ncbi:hypothetical protein L198_04696 [Cryptococcus wingfieldii CBS 7118]|uniref:Uncharacterized protein n=1 Tax=Cryptococcus wingfieldii CBS 7118 TaxID=1295528 RepID=A0A1E3J377_9TREE|nr:hypothetical protein L198_04696 [Cryptococcus wingfieldii CBS 7118]ODN95303.1 hypothetical protein L198_04696 [Cryptococcus wingfieldii CBS 7118]
MACGIRLADLDQAQNIVTLGHDAVLEGPPALDRLLPNCPHLSDVCSPTDPAFYHYKEAMDKHKKSASSSAVCVLRRPRPRRVTLERVVLKVQRIDAGEVKLKGSAVPSVVGSAGPSTSVYLL